MIGRARALVFVVALVVAATSFSANYCSAQDVASFERVLRGSVKKDGLVDYVGLKRDSTELERFLSSLEDVSREDLERKPESEQIAFWINAYNAVTLMAVTRHYPVADPKTSDSTHSPAFPSGSIRQIPGVWDKLSFVVAGRAVTINDIEHRILRGQFVEPRIHMAIARASRGGAVLRSEPYVGIRLNQQLEDQTKQFFRDRRNVVIDSEKHQLGLSAIFDWYKKDFERGADTQADGSTEPAPLLAFVKKYVPQEEASQLKDERLQIFFLPFDWSLNEYLSDPSEKAS